MKNLENWENTKIAIGSDHGGFELKAIITKYLKEKDIEFKDFGTFDKESCDYPVFAKKVAQAVSEREFDRGILVCGSGIGVSIAANKVKGVRAALCWNEETARLSREHNNSNIICMGERQLDSELALEMVKTWLQTDFEGGRHQKRIDMID